MRRIRPHLLEERQLPAEQMVRRGCWRLGRSDQPDADYGLDDLE